MKRQIPNILTVLRLIMVPVFAYTYFALADGNGVYITAGIYILAWATDVLDGWLARRNNWITDIGKLLDPLADKLMQITAAVCFTIDNRIFLCLLIPLLIKELGMVIGALIIIRKTNVVVQSHWYGKTATVLLFGCALTRIVFRGYPTLDIILCVIMLVSMLFALIMYYIHDFKGKYDLKISRKK